MNYTCTLLSTGCRRWSFWCLVWCSVSEVLISLAEPPKWINKVVCLSFKVQQAEHVRLCEFFILHVMEDELHFVLHHPCNLGYLLFELTLVHKQLNVF